MKKSYNSIEELAKVLDIPLLLINRINQLSNFDDAYNVFKIPKKKKGSFRTIEEPAVYIKELQKELLTKVIYTLPVTTEAHGFIPKRSIYTNAKKHVGQDIVFTLDIKNFFPSIKRKQVEKALNSPRFSDDVQQFMVKCLLLEERLPQGACTSPYISNVVCQKLDKRLNCFAHKYNLSYSRYADDLTFSGKKITRMTQKRIRAIIASEQFVVNESKCRLFRKSERQLVTGVVVNEKTNIANKELKLLRAIFHKVEILGIEEALKIYNQKFKKDLSIESFKAYLRGRVSFIKMINPTRARYFLARMDLIK